MVNFVKFLETDAFSRFFKQQTHIIITGNRTFLCKLEIVNFDLTLNMEIVTYELFTCFYIIRHDIYYFLQLHWISSPFLHEN